ncbi:TerB family tellurite resistance protein [Albidovulum sp.]|uniref:tellurite resistance TerB family protein n=1 Tax=Albidovulum sp. TaxID=1872424 RepID=UPI001D4A307C|nr:TerB family tellurite resistance protein [Paracoccaceae bacterium]HPE25909.1 TerB family tellurite resistance protein [Albidovulum sp.]MCB2117808.1 TerB family tellurite resistance protein [Paracoccaceae bacterium]MCB2121693.1 TerB family tellurite resistance protein [Paracoccaceae bacterium]MCB2132507.1 TerB family tellurite resistance protein [Paracoccaceae bacterium]
MFGKLLAALMAPSPSLPVADARLALAALLVRIARADGSYAPEEAFRIDRVLAHRHALSPFAASDLRLRAEALEAEAPDTVRFTRALKDAVPHEDRIDLIEALWSVALADGQRDAEEDAVIRLAAGLLGVSDAESGMARQRMERKG